jgi:hypothetical protein
MSVTQAINEYGKKNLVPCKLPTEVFVDVDMPHINTGKINKAGLMNMLPEL